MVTSEELKSNKREGLEELRTESHSIQWVLKSYDNHKKLAKQLAEMIGEVKDICEWDELTQSRTLHLVTAHSVKGGEYKNSVVYTYPDVLFSSSEVQLVALTRAGKGSKQIVNGKLADLLGVRNYLA